MNTDVEWEKWAKQDPYFAVIAVDKYRKNLLTEEVKAEFFASGEHHVEDILKTCRRHLEPDFIPRRALELGCGVGRVILPLARVAEHVVGLDVSGSMLEEARNNCERRALKNVTLLKSEDNLSCLSGKFDFIHSFIVFQHVPVERGNRILGNLLDHLEDGGICVIQLTYAKARFPERLGMPPPASYFRRAAWTVKGGVRSLLGVTRSHRDPKMQMNPYNMNEVLFLIQSAGVQAAHLEFTDHAGELGIFLYFQKPRKP